MPFSGMSPAILIDPFLLQPNPQPLLTRNGDDKWLALRFQKPPEFTVRFVHFIGQHKPRSQT